MSRKVIAFAASSSIESINKKLVTYATGLLTDCEVQILDLNDFEMPLFSVDREAQLGQPEPAQRFFQLIGDCDGLVISLAEHNGNYTAAYKNLFDWVSRINPKFYQGKPVVLFGTSPGGRGAKSVLEIALNSMPRFDANIKSSLSIPHFHEVFDTQTAQVVDTDLQSRIQNTLNQLFE